MANNRELSQFGSLVEVSNEATSIKVGLADANVGLGTTNPTERLEVHGNIKVVDGSINVAAAGTFTQQTTFSAGVGIADSIFHVGDVDTQIRFPAADIVSVETAGSERFRVESGGGIGIGDSIYHLGDTNTQVRFPGADTFTVQTAGFERFRVGSNGYVSVGKGAQGDELLHVGSASSLSPAIKVENDQGSLLIGRRQTSRFGIGTEGNVIQSVGDDFAIGTSDSEDFTIGTNNEKRITVKSNGRVGIGTDDPDELLEVLGKAKVIDLDASNISVASGVGTFQTLKVTGDLTVEGTTTTLDTNLIGVDRVEVGANSNSIVGVAVTQSGKADILKLFNGAGTEVLGITTDGNITIQNTDPGSSAAPELSLYRNSASPANADYLGQIKFQGENDAGGKVVYAKITGKILDVDSTSEDGILEFAFQKGGSNNISGRFRSDSLQLLNGTALSVAGDITANANIQGDGSTNISNINDITASGDLTIDGVSDLDELTVAGVSTFSGNIFVGAAATVGFGTHVSFRDTAKAVFGASSDLQIYHDGTNSYVSDTGTGGLKITGSDVYIRNISDQDMIHASSGSFVKLYHNNSEKLATTGLGVTVSGNLGVRTDLTVYGALDVDGVANLDEVVVAGVSTFSANLDVDASVDVSTDLTVDGITDLDELKVAGVSTFSDTVEIPSDSKKILLGADKEMQVFHDGTDSLIKDTRNSGSVKIQADSFSVIDKDASETMLSATVDGAVTLNHNGSTKFKTTGLGVTVSGNLGVRTDLTVYGKIGINEPSPDQKLHITQTASGEQYPVLLQNRTNADSSVGIQFIATGSDLSDGQYASIEANGPTAGNTKHDLLFKTVANGGTPKERLRIASNGDVGIGTNSPNFSSFGSNTGGLEISDVDTNNALLVQSGANEFYFANTSTTNYIWGDDDAAIVFGTNDTEKLRIKSDGLVGIGTNNPTHTLQLFGTSSSTLRISKKGVLAYDHTFDGSTYEIKNNNGSAGIPIIFGTQTSGGESLRIAADGKLSITGSTANMEYLRMGGNNGRGLRFSSSSGSSSVGVVHTINAPGDSGVQGEIVLQTNSTERLRITSAGLVGINSTSPTTALDIQSTKNGDGLTITKAGTRSAFLGHNGSGNEGLLILRESGTNKVQLYAESGQPSFINSGNLGIGTAVPTWKTTIVGGSAGAETTTLNLHVHSTTTGTGSILRFSNSNSVTSTYGTAEIRGVRASHDTGKTDLIFTTSTGASVTEKLRIMGDYARIGIGTTNPKSYANSQATLVIHDTVNPSLCISDSGQTRDWWLVGHGDGLAVKYADGGHVSGVQNVTNLAFFRNNGNFGLNETEPDFPLHLSQGMVANTPYFIHMGQSGNQNAVGGGAGIQFDTSASNTDNTLYLAQISGERSISNDGSNTLVFKTTKASVAGDSGVVHSPKTRMVLTEDGRLGIGVTNPSVVLEATSTDAIKVPVGTTAERPTGAAGYIRYNSSIASYEGHNGSEWAGIGGAAEVETSVSSTAATTCESFAKATYRSASIIAQITQGSSYQVGNYLLIHDGTTVTLVEESAVATGDMLGSFTATISGSNVVFQVNMASATAATVTTKMTKVSIP